jgi:hypothetical protein
MLLFSYKIRFEALKRQRGREGNSKDAAAKLIYENPFTA